MYIAKPFVYVSSHGRQYYLHGGQELPYGLRLYSVSMDDTGALTSIPSGYTILERENSEHIPALVSKKHTQNFPNCQWERLLDLAENCNTAFYLSAISSPDVRKRKESLIEKAIAEIEEIGKIVTCSECQKEIKWQVQLQKDGIGVK